MYRISGFIKKLNSADTLNAHNCVNPTGIVYIRCTNCLDLQKIYMSRIV